MGLETHLNASQRKRLREVARENGLKFIIIYGSLAKEQHKPESDIDIAILGEKKAGLKKYLYLFTQFSEIFPGKEIDLKSLHRVDPLFRYLVVRDGMLLCGNPTDYLEFKSYAFRDYQESQSLFSLQKRLIQKRQTVLLSL